MQKKSRAGFGQRFFFGSESFFGASGSIEVHLDEISCQLGHRTQSSRTTVFQFSRDSAKWREMQANVSHPRFFLFFFFSLSLCLFLSIRRNSVSVEKLNEEEEARKMEREERRDWIGWDVRACASIAEFQTIERTTHAKRILF